MYKKAIFSILIFMFSCALFGQQETVGFEYNQQYRNLDDLRTTSGIWALSYRYQFPSNTRIAASLGLDNVKFYQNEDDTNPMLKSNNQIFVQLEALQVLYYFYLKGAVQYYTINGNSYESTSSESEVKYKNNYNMFEFPLGLGLAIPTKYFDIYLGANKTYIYGSNRKEVLVNNRGTETSLGNSAKQTFKSEMEIGIEGSLYFHLSKEMNLEVNGLWYSDKDFSIKVAVWGPLKRMYYIK